MARSNRHVLFLAATLAATLVGFSRTASAADLDGCWDGCWKSECNGHDGKLRARICKVDDMHYCAHFSGNFWEIFPFRYSVMLTAKQEGDKLTLEGCKNLGPLVGTFSFEGTVVGDEFKATYTARRDRGEFNMTRLPLCGCCR